MAGEGVAALQALGTVWVALPVPSGSNVTIWMGAGSLVSHMALCTCSG